MRQLIQYIVDYQRKYFDFKLYVSLALFLSGSILINYIFDFEDQFIDPIPNLWVKSIAFAFFQAIPFLVTGFLLAAFDKKRAWLTESTFWIIFILGFLIIGSSRAIHWGVLLKPIMAPEYYLLLRSTFNWSLKLLMILLFFGGLYCIYDRPLRNFYGFTFHKFDLSPYLILLGVAVLFILVGSFFADIQAYYPRYKPPYGLSFATHHELPNWVSLLIYESSYATSFIAVEFIFRGFLIYAFIKYFGEYAVLPMVATYCFLHFGKPATETISSIFGGYILGIVALKNKNIWGGVIVHIGVAWSMELFGYLQARF